MVIVDRQDLIKMFALGIAFLAGSLSVRVPQVTVNIDGLDKFIEQTRSNEAQLMKWRVEDRNRINALEKNRVTPMLPEPDEYKEMKQ